MQAKDQTYSRTHDPADSLRPELSPKVERFLKIKKFLTFSSDDRGFFCGFDLEAKVAISTNSAEK